MRLARTLRGIGQTLITAGVVILLFVSYELWFTGVETAREQKALTNAIEDDWVHGGGSYKTPADLRKPIPIGKGVAVLHIPRFGDGWAKAVVEGVSRSDLKKGPGHYPGTQLPGQLGNFVVSGHRTTYGAPFGQIGELRAGDPVVVETRDTWYTYRVTVHEIVRPTRIEVTYPVPGHDGVKPTRALLTLTSCHPKYSAKQRIVVYAQLAETTAKAGDELPPALRSG